MNITVLGIDLAKEVFQLHGINHQGKAVLQKQVRRGSLLNEVLKLPRSCIIAMEACGGAHYWAREFAKAGFEVRLIAPQFVKPYVKSHKNDRADAAAIAEAATREHMHFVSVKSKEQQELSALHCARERLVKNRTGLVNEIRGFLTEFGVVAPQGVQWLGRTIRKLKADSLPPRLWALIRDMLKELHTLEERIAAYTFELERLAKENPVCKRLLTIRGVGPITATALYAATGDPRQYRNGRTFAAALGLVPRQYSSGGKSHLGHITKRGDKYLRKLLVHGARAVLRSCDKKTDSYSLWASRLYHEKGYNLAAVALANKNARIAWVIMTSPEATFSPDTLSNGPVTVH